MIDFKRCPDGMPCSGNCMPFGCQRDARPAAPESETPLGQCSGPFSDAKDCQVHKGDLLAAASCGHNDRFKCVFGLPREDDGCLACALERTERQHSLAQTEIKGHMRVEDDLKTDLRRTKADLVCAEENFHVTNQAYVKADNERTQAQARIAELEKDWETDADYVRMAERIKELEKLLGEALENLIWCGGSADFGWGGKAQVGYDKGPRTTIAAIHEALKSRA